jgi:hypothetical protein
MQWFVGSRRKAISRKTSVRTTLKRIRPTCHATIFALRDLALN